MEKTQRIILLLFLSIVISLSLASFVSSVVAETKKANKNDVKLVNALCYMPQSHSFVFGMAAIICLVIAHTITNLVICANFFCFSSLKKPQPAPAVPAGPGPLPPSNSTVSVSSSASSDKSSGGTKHTITAMILLFISWASFGMAVVLLWGATSMSGTQSYGNGWVDGKCYVVKDGIYAGSGVLTLLSTAAALASAVVTVPKPHSDPGRRVHAQATPPAATAVPAS
ncbi:Protein MODIFYING WALL LIGNIN-2 [Linum perenne]